MMGTVPVTRSRLRHQPLTALAGPDGKWLQIACNQGDAGVMTVCERRARRTALAGWWRTALHHARHRGEEALRHLDPPATAEDADQFCRSYEGGSLVVVRLREEREELAREIRQSSRRASSTRCSRRGIGPRRSWQT